MRSAWLFILAVVSLVAHVALAGKDYYSVLGVGRDASKVRSALLASDFHELNFHIKKKG